MSRLILILFSIVAVLLGASFTVINSDNVPVNLYLQSYQVPMALAVFISMFLGAIIGALACSGLVMRRGRDMRQLRKKCKRAEDEIARLRQLPSTGKV